MPEAPVGLSDLVDHCRRRFSDSSDDTIASANSKFSFVSAVVSMQSFDSNCSIVEGSVLGRGSVPLRECAKQEGFIKALLKRIA